MQVATDGPVSCCWHSGCSDGWSIAARSSTGWGTSGMYRVSREPCQIRIREASTELQDVCKIKSWYQKKIGKKFLHVSRNRKSIRLLLIKHFNDLRPEMKARTLEGHFTSLSGYLCVYILFGTLAHVTNYLEAPELRLCLWSVQASCCFYLQWCYCVTDLQRCETEKTFSSPAHQELNFQSSHGSKVLAQSHTSCVCCRTRSCVLPSKCDQTCTEPTHCVQYLFC